MENKKSAWLVRRFDGKLLCFDQKPKRVLPNLWASDNKRFIILEADIRPELKYEDEPEEYSFNIENE